MKTFTSTTFHCALMEESLMCVGRRGALIYGHYALETGFQN